MTRVGQRESDPQLHSRKMEKMSGKDGRQEIDTSSLKQFYKYT